MVRARFFAIHNEGFERCNSGDIPDDTVSAASLAHQDSFGPKVITNYLNDTLDESTVRNKPDDTDTNSISDAASVIDTNHLW